MPTAIYRQGSSSSDGNTVAYTLTGPPVLHPDGSGAALISKAQQAAVRAAGAQGLRKAVAAYSPPAIKAGWELTTRTLPDLLIQIRNAVPLALWVEEPTQPHDIVAHGPGFPLHWQDAGGSDHYARRVHHPGTPGKHRLPDLTAALGRDFEAQIAKRVTPVLQGLAEVVGDE